jgi:hypothetical protein
MEAIVERQEDALACGGEQAMTTAGADFVAPVTGSDDAAWEGSPEWRCGVWLPQTRQKRSHHGHSLEASPLRAASRIAASSTSCAIA